MANKNPMLDTQEYEVKFLDRHHESLSANVIVQHMFSQVDEEGHRYLFLDDIIDFHRNDSAVDNEDVFVVMQNGVKHCKLMATVVSVEGWQH